jgi:hypothetical protein
MAIHTDLSIHKSCCDLLRVTMEATKEMRRDFKSSIGTEVRALCVSMLLSVMRANKTVNASQKIAHIDQVLEDVEVFNDLFRVCRDVRVITTPVYARATEITGSIGRQAGGWRKSASSPVASPSRR